MAIKALAIKKIGLWIFLVLVFIAIALRLWQSEWKPQQQSDLRFTQISLPYSHKLDKASLPFVASAAFDVDGDGRDEIFIGGGREQDDLIFKFHGTRLTKLDTRLFKDLHDASHGATHLDIDNDGDVDLFVARESCVWLHLNLGDNQFESLKIFTPPKEDKTTPLSITLGDVNKDGLVDLYVSGYIKNKFVDGTTNFSDGYGGYSYLLMGDKNNIWHDVTDEAGLRRQHNTFTAVFADLDNDHDSDLIIAQDTGVIEMYENTGTFPMQPIPNPSVNSYPMGLAIGDYNNDGLVDIYASNVGHTLPAFMLSMNVAKGEDFNPDYYLLKNNGNLKFTDTAKDAGIARLGFGWGTAFADLNIDGHLDLMAAQNYVKMPAIMRMKTYASKTLQNKGDGTFQLVGKAAGTKNKAFGITPVIADFNGDDKPDIVWININGPSRALINQSKTEGGHRIRLPNTVHSIGALIYPVICGHPSAIRQIIAGQGLGSDPSRTLFLPSQSENVRIIFQDGTSIENNHRD